MDNDYKVPAQTRIGHVHLKVSNLQRSLDFYCGLLGFDLTTTYGNYASFLSADGYQCDIGLNVWFSRNSAPTPGHLPGLFHTAILYHTREDLAIIFQRLHSAGYPFTGASDHGVSEALYLDDPDGNGVELYWDRPKEEWPKNPDGSLHMYTRHLDLQGLLAELEKA